MEGRIVELWCDGSSGDTKLEEAMADLMQRKFNLFKRKQRSYGPNNIAALGLRGVFVRVWDKVQRLKNLVWDNQENPLNDESLEDTWGDIAIYSLMAILVMNDKWPKWEHPDIPNWFELMETLEVFPIIEDMSEFVREHPEVFPKAKIGDRVLDIILTKMRSLV